MNKTKLELEYIINTSPIILFNCLTTASGLSEWFCDDVNLKDDKFTFFGTVVKKLQFLKVLEKENRSNLNGRKMKMKILFEMTIRIDDLTKEVALIVTDFFEGEDEEEELRLLWDNNIHKLKQAIGG